MPVAEAKAQMRDRINARALALIEQAFEQIANRADPAGSLVKQYDKDAMTFIERAVKATTPPAEAGKPNNINNLFVLAAKQAAQLPVLDAEAVPVEPGVQRGYEPDEPVDW